jgi:hypothetical protein
VLNCWLTRGFLLGLVIVLDGVARPSEVFAQDIPNKMFVLSENDEEFAKCGLTQSGIEAAGKASLRYNRIEILDKDEAYFLPHLYVVITPIVIGGELCVSSINVSVRQYDTYPDGFGKYYSGFYDFCSQAAILSGPNHASRVYESIRQQTDECLAGISKTGNASQVRTWVEAAGAAPNAANER